jgi:hypothetical protein
MRLYRKNQKKDVPVCHLLPEGVKKHFPRSRGEEKREKKYLTQRRESAKKGEFFGTRCISPFSIYGTSQFSMGKPIMGESRSSSFLNRGWSG